MKFAICVFLCLFYKLSVAQTSKTNRLLKNSIGVPLEMANYRTKQLKDVQYHLTFDIPEKKDSPIQSKVLIYATLLDLSNPLYLDFKAAENAIKKVIVNKNNVPINFEKEHVIINHNDLVLGDNTIEIDFVAGDLSLNRNEEYLYTLLVPDRARTLFPCFDQPNIKASYFLNLTAPKAWQVLAGSSIEEKHIEGNDKISYKFKKSDNMSTYLFSFVAGKFKTTNAEGLVQPMKMLHRETNNEKLLASEESIFKLHQSSLDFLETYTQYKFPFQKLDFAVIPGFQYRGMEHVGAIQYRASSLFLDDSATRNQELFRAKLIAHETAHMWFGNLVTMQWFNDVWLKEVFANFMADKIVNPVFTDINHDLQFLTSHYPRAYAVDRTKGTNPIRQQLKNLNNAGSLYGSIIYHKAPIMMRQLELALGENLFKEGLQEYINKFANSSAEWNDLIRILDKKIPLDLKKWSNVWVNSSGRPIFNGEIAYSDKNTIKSFRINQQAEDGSDHIWPQIFEISLVYPNKIQKFTINSSSASVDIQKLKGLPKPNYIIYNSNGFGYGVFPTNATAINQIAQIKSEVSRAHEYLNNFELVFNGSIPKETVFESLKKGLILESNELILRIISKQITEMFWYHFTAADRLKNQDALEALLLDRLKGKSSKNIKKILFKTYQDIAYSESGVTELYKIWSQQVSINALVLNQDDYTKLASLLALYSHPKTAEILATTQLKQSNLDKKERFNFMLPALSNNSDVRASFFNALQNASNREKESWVETACAYIHHPLRQGEAIKYVNLSLTLLEEIQKTGDIFFPKGWLNATIGKYNSQEAYEMVEHYLTDHPDLDSNLKQKLLQATDLMYRKQKEKITD
ncbi:M1 family metallopeptidase [Aquimarina agarivorans]|uniref:M1 family metallopeptidase n=1 Tax=Aquimarina agarivorans TaxID=980584 RepID=UPI000248E808|nr:M1 family aminopeptidase [Aquimarina agarivorans]